MSARSTPMGQGLSRDVRRVLPLGWGRRAGSVTHTPWPRTVGEPRGFWAAQRVLLRAVRPAARLCGPGDPGGRLSGPVRLGRPSGLPGHWPPPSPCGCTARPLHPRNMPVPAGFPGCPSAPEESPEGHPQHDRRVGRCRVGDPAARRRPPTTPGSSPPTWSRQRG
jgi:hypothetical protein